MENLHLGHEDDIVEIMQVEAAKCIITRGPTGAKGRPNRAEMGLGRSAQADWPNPLPASVQPPFPCTRRIFNPKALEAPPFAEREPFAPGGHPQARERGGRSPEGDRPPRRKHPQVEKKEDTVGRVTVDAKRAPSAKHTASRTSWLYTRRESRDVPVNFS
jgi:hypothetical protein